MGAREVPLGGVAVDLRGLGFGMEAKFQNCSEFIGIIVGILGLISEGWDRSAIAVRGDSKTALSWVEKGNFRSSLATNAATVFVAIKATKGFTVVDATHLSHDENWRTDMLSRKGAEQRWDSLIKELGEKDPALKGLPMVPVNISKLLRLCDPSVVFEQCEEFGKFWGEVQELIASL